MADEISQLFQFDFLLQPLGLGLLEPGPLGVQVIVPTMGTGVRQRTLEELDRILHFVQFGVKSGSAGTVGVDYREDDLAHT